MDYTLFQAEDFVADESFNAYYLHTDPSAVAFWKNWISLHPEKMDEVYNAEQILATLHLRLEDEDLQQAFSRFDDFLAADLVPTYGGETEKKSFFTAKTWTGIGAFAALVVVAVFFLKQFFAEKPIIYTSYYNGFGKTTQLTLSDGSKVTLNANSTLKFPKSFAADRREVTLTGEAFFEVTKDKNRPFSVTAKRTKTTVLGTKFNVSAYAGNTETKIALVEGKVVAEANAGKDKLTLQPAEMATFNPSTKQLKKETFNPTEITGWKSGLLIFNQAGFEEIAARFKNVYGVDLINHTKNINWSFSAQFDHADYITVVKGICFAKNLKFKQNQHTIILTQ